MATGRTLQRHTRFYLDGFDLSGYARSLGDLKQEYEAPVGASWTEAVKNMVARGNVSLGVGTFNGFFDNTATSGLHIVAKGAGVKRTVMVPKGIRAAPAQGDPVYAGEFTQSGYSAQDDGGFVVASIPFEDADGAAAALDYSQPWGVLLHANSAATAANAAAGVDNGDDSHFGGFLCYQLFAFATAGSVVVKVQEADANEDASFGDLTGATSGSIASTAIPCAGIVKLGHAATVKRYLRWQIALTDMTSITFALSFHRAYMAD